MTNTDLVHAFAAQHRESATTPNGNLFFERNKIYSYGYHYLLAEIKEGNIILINDTGYSVTTGKHISLVTGATRQYTQYFKTQYDLNHVHEVIIELKTNLARARKPEIYIGQIRSKFEKLTANMEALKIKRKTDKKYLELKRLYKALENDSKNYVGKIAETQKKAAKKAAAKRKKEQIEKLEKFHNYETNYISTHTLPNEHLRISKDGEKVETTQGASVTIREAKLLYDMIVAKKPINGHRIGIYRVKSIDKTLEIGCHKINITSMHEVGKKL